MDRILRIILVLTLCIIPITFVLLAIRRGRLRRHSGSKAPFAELRRRPAGEALREKLEELDEKIMQDMFSMVLFPGLAAFLEFQGRDASWVGAIVIGLFSVPATLFFGFRLNRTLRTRDNYQLGYDGERFVGEELTRLIAKGFEVYHDVPFDGFNIDHVLVGPSGVYSVETKTRRKPVDPEGNKEFRVVFDGACLRWPWGSDTYGLDQANRNSQTLGKWLSQAVGENVQSTAILTLPGWLVDRKAPATAVHVLNPKEILKMVASRPVTFSENLARRVCYQLDQKCKIGMG